MVIFTSFLCIVNIKSRLIEKHNLFTILTHILNLLPTHWNRSVTSVVRFTLYTIVCFSALGPTAFQYSRQRYCMNRPQLSLHCMLSRIWLWGMYACWTSQTVDQVPTIINWFCLLKALQQPVYFKRMDGHEIVSLPPITSVWLQRTDYLISHFIV